MSWLRATLPPTLMRLARLALLPLLLTTMPVSAATDITWARLLAPQAEPQNWLMTNGDVAGHRYSALDMIDRSNVGGLKLLKTIPYGDISAGETFERMRLSTPLVLDGLGFFTDGLGRVYKQRLTPEGDGPGTPIWVAEPAVRQIDKWMLAQWSLVLHDEWVILATGDGELFWIDADTGAIERDVRIGDPTSGYALVAPPIVVDGRLILGGAGGDRGARPRIDAIDATTGDTLWTLVPGLAAGGAETPFIPGASFLRAGTFDPVTRLMLWSTSGPIAPSPYREAEGYDATNTLFAIDVDTGAMRWSLPYPRQSLASEEGTVPIVRPAGPQSAAVGVHLGDMGAFHRVDLASGSLLSNEQVVALSERPGCPNIRSEPQMPGTVSARTGRYYAAVNNGCTDTPPQELGIGGDAIGGDYVARSTATGVLLALDPASGAVVGTKAMTSALQSGLLSTAGGLVFAVTADGGMTALDDETLEPLWSHLPGSIIASPPITYAANGRQYVMVVLGGGPLYSMLPYVPGGMRGVRHVTVLAIYGLEE